MMKKIGFSIVIPILNESQNIKKLVKKIFLSLKNFKFEIIFVDDKSQDNSSKILKELNNKYAIVKYILRNKSRDLSKSCDDGIKMSKYNFIIIMDGDLQHDPIFIPKLINTIVKHNLDVVIGTRNFSNRSSVKMSRTRFFLSRLITYLFNVLLGKLSNDPMSGFFVFKKKKFLKNKKFFLLNGFKILADFIYNSRKLKIADVIISFRYRISSKSKMTFKIIIKIIYLFIYILLKKIFKKIRFIH